ncbi:ABC transporter permease [Clostridium zeae]|uniref:ABC transporter permease n=1 Tax=Clostridium zeae TaxID=2759022 RepID=A0ABQ1E6S8_9CLOT|nr:ABC transporter permease [Clostridium zeae]GFZ30434.1 ABC transporter permease [Clostridium zeae]
MLNFNYALLGLAKRKRFVLLSVFQLSVSLLFLYSSIYLSNQVSFGNSKILKLFDNKIIFKMQNKDDYYDIVYRNEGDTEKYEQFDEYLKSSQKFKHVSYTQSLMAFSDFDGSSQFGPKYGGFSLNKENINFNGVYSLTLDDRYLDAFALKLDSGKLFQKTDYYRSINSKEITPIIMGSDYKEKFKLNDIVKFLENDVVKEAKVIGFIEKDQYFIADQMSFNNLTSLNKFILFPQRKLGVEAYNSVADDKLKAANYKLDVYNNITNSFIIIDNKYKGQEDEIANEIASKSRDMKFFNFKVYSVQKELDRFTQMFRDQNNIINTIFVIVLGICSIGIISNTIYSLRSKYKEFAVHIMSGASLFDIAIRVFYEILVLAVISGYVCYWFIIGVQKAGMIKFDTLAFIKLQVFNLLIAVLISIVPIMDVMKVQLNTLLKGKE